MAKWDYKVIESDDKIDFESLGNEGWELVAVLPPHNLSYTKYFFKKHKTSRKRYGTNEVIDKACECVRKIYGEALFDNEVEKYFRKAMEE